MANQRCWSSKGMISCKKVTLIFGTLMYLLRVLRFKIGSFPPPFLPVMKYIEKKLYGLECGASLVTVPF